MISPLILPKALRVAEEAASKALPQWATALIVIFALVAVVATVVVGFFLKRARSALEVPTLLNENICSFSFSLIRPFFPAFFSAADVADQSGNRHGQPP